MANTQQTTPAVTFGLDVQITPSSAIYLVLTGVAIIVIFFLSKKYIR